MSFFDKLDKIRKSETSRLEEKPKTEKPKISRIEKPKKIIRKWTIFDFSSLIATFIFEGFESGILEIVKNSQKRGIRISEVLTVLPIPPERVKHAFKLLELRGKIYKDKNSYYHYKEA